MDLMPKMHKKDAAKIKDLDYFNDDIESVTESIIESDTVSDRWTESSICWVKICKNYMPFNEQQDFEQFF